MAQSKRKNPAAVALGKLGGKPGISNPAKGHSTEIARAAGILGAKKRWEGHVKAIIHVNKTQ